MDENKGFENQIEVVNKRIDDLKWSINLYAGAVSLLALALSIFLGLKLSSEAESLRDLKKELREEVKESLGKTAKLPELTLTGLDGEPLQGRELKATFTTRDDGSVWLSFDVVVKNIGRATSGPIFTKFYTTEPLVLHAASTDEPEFQYEDFIEPESIKPQSLPAGVSLHYKMSFILKPSTVFSEGKYPALFKLSYGDGLSTRTIFTVILES